MNTSNTLKHSNEFKRRHGFADFDNRVFKITNGKDDSTVDCELIKVPTYSFQHTYTEKICEGNGWYSNGDKITKTITHDFYWLIVLDGKCLGVINTNSKKSVSSKYAIEKTNKYINEFVKTL